MWPAVLLLACVVLCNAEVAPVAPGAPRGALRITGDDKLTYNDVLVKRVNESLSLLCGDGSSSRDTVVRWNYPRAEPKYINTPQLEISALRQEDTGFYICESEPYSISKYIVVQPPAPTSCARGGFSCGHLCVLHMYVCDGHKDCLHGEDESEASCGTATPCEGKLSCDGRCISAARCCDAASADCVRPSCCELYAEAQPDIGLDSLGRRADYGFIQSTIYTVTACALIFMIAVVLLVSAICKMHMKRAALRSYARAERARQHYGPPCQFPPCYDASHPLTEPFAAPESPQRIVNAPSLCAEEGARCETAEGAPPRPTTLGLARLADSVFSSRYSRVPTQCCDVEMSSMATVSPRRTEEAVCAGAEWGGAPVGCGADEEPRRVTAVERLLDRFTFDTSYRVDSMERDYGPAESLTLHIGRFQVSLPRFARRPTSPRARPARRPDTPNVEQLDIDRLEFVRLNDTYTLNGRTIRLLGADFENYPGGAASFVGRVVAPPPYSEAVAVAPSKILGPPPAYLSRENLRNDNDAVSGDRTSTAMVDCNGNARGERGESPPRYASNANLDESVMRRDAVLSNGVIRRDTNFDNSGTRTDANLDNSIVCRDANMDNSITHQNTNLDNSVACQDANVDDSVTHPDANLNDSVTGRDADATNNNDTRENVLSV